MRTLKNKLLAGCALTSLLAGGAFLNSCSNETESSGSDGASVRATVANAGEATANYEYTQVCRNLSAGTSETKTGLNASFTLPLHYNYQLQVTAVSASTAITKAESVWTVDLTQTVPDILNGTSAEFVPTASAAIPVTLNRLGTLVDFSIDASAVSTVSGITVTIGNLYDQVNISDNSYAAAGGTYKTKTIALTKSGSTFTGSTYLLPSKADETNLALTYVITYDDTTTKTIQSTPVGKIEANIPLTINNTGGSAAKPLGEVICTPLDL